MGERVWAVLEGFSDTTNPQKYQRSHRRIKHFISLVQGLKIDGQERLPERPYILAPTHVATRDPFYAPMVEDRFGVHFMAKKELWGWQYAGFGRWYMNERGCFVVDRKKPGPSSLKEADRLLKDGLVVGLYPEGTRVRGEVGGELHAGIGWLAVRNMCQIVPVGIAIGKDRPRVNLYVGEPVCPAGTDAGDRSQRINQTMEMLAISMQSVRTQSRKLAGLSFIDTNQEPTIVVDDQS